MRKWSRRSMEGGRVGRASSEVVTVGAPIVTIMDLSQPGSTRRCPRRRPTASNLAIRCASSCQRRHVYGKVIAKAAEGDFATQRDVNSMKRDIKTSSSSCSFQSRRKFVPA